MMRVSRNSSNRDAKHILVFDEPVNEFEYRLNATPLGNGRLGCMFTGGPARDLLLLNHESLRPVPYRENETLAGDGLEKMRALCLKGDWDGGNEVFSRMVRQTGTERKLNSYHPVCDLIVELGLPGFAEDYSRKLDLKCGFGEVAFSCGDVDFIRRYFVSANEQQVVMQCTASFPGAINLRASLGRMPTTGCRVHAESVANRISLSGVYDDGTRFTVHLELVADGGQTTAGDECYDGAGEIRENYAAPLAGVSVTDANEVALFVGIEVENPVESADDTATRIYSASAAAVKHADSDKTIEDAERYFLTHCSEHSELFGRARIELTAGVQAKGTADDMIREVYRGNASPHLFETVFDMGRYLLLSSSRKCLKPANLQGIWNHTYDPPWQCRYQLDVNLQANYWAANSTNLPECNEPLFGFLERLVPAARRFARDLYGCRGITFGVATDGENVRYPSNVETQCIAGWLVRHFWDHYLFTLDRSFLESRAYPIMREIGEFFEDFLFEGDDGRLVILPSNSPENAPANRTVRLSKNATIDLEVAKEVFQNLISAATILGDDLERIPAWRDILEGLPDTPVVDGLLREWADDEAEEHQAHRHLSHLYGLFPGSTFRDDPILIDAAITALEEREKANQGDACSFTYVWAALLYARAGRGNEAFGRLKLYCRGFLMENFMSSMGDRRQLGLGRSRSANLASHIFQIEACLAATSAITEMLLQSDSDLVHVLPALPDVWSEGKAYGLRARGGYTIDISWNNRRLNRVVVQPIVDGRCTIRFGIRLYGDIQVLQGHDTIEHTAVREEIVTFEVEAGKSYTIGAGDDIA
jgi:alpha-L-fucosidase 2